MISEISPNTKGVCLIPTPKFNDKVADTDEDGELTIIDATYIQRWLAALPSNDKIGEPIK